MSAETEEIRRLAARTINDVNRGMPFEVGVRRFTEFVVRAVEVMDSKLAQMEKMSKGGKDDTGIPGAP